MSKRLPALSALEGDQLRASDPADHAALSPSAGTGKTHVLTARVLGLLLAGPNEAAVVASKAPPRRGIVTIYDLTEDTAPPSLAAETLVRSF